MAVINPHINFNGNAEEAFNFYKSVFGGEFQKIVRFKEISSPEYQVGEKELNKIMNISLPIGHNLLIGNDVPEMMGRVNENENRSKISIAADSEEEANKLFQGLSKGGNVEIANESNASNSFYSMLRDKFGIEWIISFSKQEN